MATISNLGPQRIEDTYQLLVQTDGVSLYSGDGKKLNISGNGGTSLSDEDIEAIKNVTQLTDRVVALEARQDKVVSSSSYDANTNILTLHIENDDANPVNIDMTQLYDDALNGYAKSTDVTTQISTLSGSINTTLNDYAKSADVTTQISTLSGSINTTLENYVTTDELPDVPTKLSQLTDDKVINEAIKATNDSDDNPINITYVKTTTYNTKITTLEAKDTELQTNITNTQNQISTLSGSINTTLENYAKSTDVTTQISTLSGSINTTLNDYAKSADVTTQISTLSGSINTKITTLEAKDTELQTNITNTQNQTLQRIDVLSSELDGKVNTSDNVWITATDYSNLSTVDVTKTYYITEI